MQARNTQARNRKPHRQGIRVRRLPAGTFRADARDVRENRHDKDRPGLVMVLAPPLGLGIWAAILFLLVG